jgi:hypothetical protein
MIGSEGIAISIISSVPAGIKVLNLLTTPKLHRWVLHQKTTVETHSIRMCNINT